MGSSLQNSAFAVLTLHVPCGSFFAALAFYMGGPFRESLYYCCFYTAVFTWNFNYALQNLAFAACACGLHLTILAFAVLTLHVTSSLPGSISVVFELHVARNLRNHELADFTL